MCITSYDLARKLPPEQLARYTVGRVVEKMGADAHFAHACTHARKPQPPVPPLSSTLAPSCTPQSPPPGAPPPPPPPRWGGGGS